MELVKTQIWLVMRWEINEEDVEVRRVVNAYNTRSEAMEKCAKYRKLDDGLKYAVRSTYSWFPK